MRKNCFDALYQFFTKNAKCLNTNHYGIPIYYCSENTCNKGYICSQCLTEDPEHFQNHFKHFIALDTRKNFFRFLQIPIDSFEESFANNFIINSRNKFFTNKEKINDANSFYDYLKNQIISTININQKSNLLKDENCLAQYLNKTKKIKNKKNEFINNSINEFIKKNNKHDIINLINQIKPNLNQKSNEVTEKDKLNDINKLISTEIPVIIQKCLNILCQIDNSKEEGDSTGIIDEENKNKKMSDNEKENDMDKDNENDNKNEISNDNDLDNDIVNLDTENNINAVKDKFNSESNKYKANQIINLINDITPIKNDINILNIELNNNNNYTNINNYTNNHKSFYEGSINNISTIKAESNLETEEFESKININMNMNNIEINKGTSPLKINNHPTVNDPFFIEKELFEKKTINRLQLNDYNFGFKKKETSLRNSNSKKGGKNSNNSNNSKENSWVGNYQTTSINENIPTPTIAAANNIQLYNNNNNIINDLEIKLKQIHNKEQDYNHLIGNYLKNNNNYNSNNIIKNNDNIIKQSNQFVIDIKKNNYGNGLQRAGTKSSINISIGNYLPKKNNIKKNNVYSNPNVNDNNDDKLNLKTKQNLNRLDKIRNQIGHLLK